MNPILSGAFRGFISATLVVGLIVACPSPSTTTLGSVDASSVESACMNLVNVVHCADIDAGSCVTGLTNLFQSQEGVQPALRCLTQSNTKALVRACTPPGVEPCP